MRQKEVKVSRDRIKQQVIHKIVTFQIQKPFSIHTRPNTTDMSDRCVRARVCERVCECGCVCRRVCVRW